MTRELWDRLFWLHMNAARKRYPTTDIVELQKRVVSAMEETFGRRPGKPPEPGDLPWWVRLVLTTVPGKERYSMTLNKWALAVVYGLIGAVAVLQTAVGDNVIELQEWVAIAGAFLTAFWAKVSNPTKIVSTKQE